LIRDLRVGRLVWYNAAMYAVSTAWATAAAVKPGIFRARTLESWLEMGEGATVASSGKQVRMHTAYLFQLYTMEMDQVMLAACLSHVGVLADRDALYQCLRTHRGCTAAISGNAGTTTPPATTVDTPNNQ
jgi:hypothetical protein